VKGSFAPLIENDPAGHNLTDEEVAICQGSFNLIGCHNQDFHRKRAGEQEAVLNYRNFGHGFSQMHTDDSIWSRVYRKNL
jgi:hypothetical protein